MSFESNPDGGYLVPPEIEATIRERLMAISPIRNIAGQRTILIKDAPLSRGMTVESDREGLPASAYSTLADLVPCGSTMM